MLPYLASFCAGALGVLAFAPFKLWWLAPISLGVLFFYLHKIERAKPAAFLALSYGMGLTMFGVSWVYNSLSVYGGMPLWMGAIAVLGFCALISSTMAAFAILVTAISDAKTNGRLLSLCVLWPVGEWTKSWFLTGFPWLDAGYSQTETWLLSLAPIGGVYLVSTAVSLLAISLVLLVRKHWLIAVSLWLVLFPSSWLLAQIEYTQATGQISKVAVVQGNLPIEEKWQVGRRQANIALYQHLVSQVDAHYVDLLVFPETALPVYLQQTDASFWSSMKGNSGMLISGVMDSPSLLTSRNLDRTFNAAVLVCGDQDAPRIYHKQHLVPFGEYLPLRFLFNWVLDYLDLPMSDLSAGDGSIDFSCTNDLHFGLSICYEDAFADEQRRRFGDIGFLVNISEDAWFGDSLAPAQRTQMAQMRATELQRWMVRGANSGPSGFIDHKGRVVALTPQFEAASLVREVQVRSGHTPFDRFGPWSIYFGLVYAFIGLLRKRVSIRP